MNDLSITLQCNLQRLTSYTDEYLAALWHANEASNAPHGDSAAEHLGAALSQEMTRRFLERVGPSLWRRQHRHASSASAVGH